MPPYEYTGPVDCSLVPDKTQLQGKSVIVTGGAQGLGEAYVRDFVKAGAFVTFCDINEEKGKALEAGIGANVAFVKCDTRSWEDQIQVFETAYSKSPQKSVDIVIANAGVGRGAGDPLMQLEDPFKTPTQPSLHIIDINLVGAIYTFKLATHYFRRKPKDDARDRCFIFIGSMAGILDNLGSWEYSVSKFGLRGLMRTVRRHGYHQGIRVNYVAPSWIRTTIQSPAVYESLRTKGAEFATVESCIASIMRISCDKTINGHSFVIVPTSTSPDGFKDAESDDWTDENHWLQKLQRTCVAVRGDAWD
ncbi:hypothetical protein H2200_009764 [Cladophialophora chaetospira]|uniref:5'-hydroxyaverantin dehydrogenase n=1 Tax=Cladophialophora chaetospira TaxID=386627 RepID=A0AA39CEV4_9EURO|nr:hypothetical protein H2200_009764 [Cladophialophora chaetospira]